MDTQAGRQQERLTFSQPATLWQMWGPINFQGGTRPCRCSRRWNVSSATFGTRCGISCAAQPGASWWYRRQSFEEAVWQAAILHRAAASLFSASGALSLLLATIGVYGVATYGVSLRAREIGIRVSLGARTTDIVWLFIPEGLALSLIGVAIGLEVSAAFSSLLTAFLFGLTAADTMTYFGGAAVLAMAAVIASYLPVRRAARVEATVALRHQ